MRLFIAIDPPEEIRGLIASLCRGLDGARWVRPEQFHVTLRFLGEVDTETGRRIGEALASVREPGFSLRFAGAGRFPPRRSPRVLWVGLEPEERLVSLHSRIERGLSEIGFAAEEKPFSPHLTIARLREGVASSDVDEWLGRAGEFRAGPFPVSRFFLYSSVLGSEGARHSREREYELAGESL